MRAAVALLLLALLGSAPQLFFSDWRGTEARRVEIAREMVQSGDWMVPTLGHEVTLAKPPLYYWLLAGLQNFGRDPMLMRLPSVLGFWLLAVVCYFPLRRHYSELSAWIGAAGILIAPTMLYHVPFAEIDPLFAALTGISIVWLAEGAAFKSRWRLIAAGLVGGAAMLIKGPPYLIFFAGSALVWGRRLRLSGAGWFLPGLLLVPLAYYVPLLLSHVSPDEFFRVASEESVGRVKLFSLESLLGIPKHLVTAVLALMPLGLWTFHEYRGDREMRKADVVGPSETFLRICAGAMISGVFILAIFPARPGRYLLPGVACFIVALGPAIAAYARFGNAPSLVLVPMVRILGILGCLGLICTPWLPFPYDRGTPFLFLTLAIGPLCVRNRRQVFLYVVVLPLIAAWTLLPDRATRRMTPPRSKTFAAEVLAREVGERGLGDWTTYGHVPPEIYLVLDRIPRGDERASATPTSDWVLVEDFDVRDQKTGRTMNLADLDGYRHRVRVQLHDKVLALQQRQ